MRAHYKVAALAARLARQRGLRLGTVERRACGGEHECRAESENGAASEGRKHGSPTLIACHPGITVTSPGNIPDIISPGNIPDIIADRGARKAAHRIVWR